MTTTEKRTVKVQLLHRSSIPNARWCVPVGWEPRGEFDGCEYIDGSWWDDHEEVASLVCFGSTGSEGDVIEVDIDDLRVVSCGDCRVLCEVQQS